MSKVKIVIDVSFGGFCFSEKALRLLGITKQEMYNALYKNPSIRMDKKWVEVVESLGSSKASSECSELKVIEVDPERPFRIDGNYGGERIVYRDAEDWIVAKETEKPKQS